MKKILIFAIVAFASCSKSDSGHWHCYEIFAIDSLDALSQNAYAYSTAIWDTTVSGTYGQTVSQAQANVHQFSIKSIDTFHQHLALQYPKFYIKDSLFRCE